MWRERHIYARRTTDKEQRDDGTAKIRRTPPTHICCLAAARPSFFASKKKIASVIKCRSSRHSVRSLHKLWVTRDAAASVTLCNPDRFRYSRAAHRSATALTPSSDKEAQKDTSRLLSFDWAHVVARAYTPASVTSVQKAQLKSSSCFKAFAT